MSGHGAAPAGETTPLYRDGVEVRWRDPGVGICLRCPAPPSACAEADPAGKNTRALRRMNYRCPLMLAHQHLGNGTGVLPLAERLAAQTLDPDRPDSVRWYERALRVQADRDEFVADLRAAE